MAKSTTTKEGAAMPRVELTARLACESKAGRKDTILFDRALPGFGLRIHPSGRKVWIVQARIEGRSRRIVIAGYAEMRLVQARRHARDLLARIRAGQNPAADIQREKQTPTFRAFAEEYLRRSDPHWKPSGRKTVRIYLKARILPAFGKMPLDRIRPEDVVAWFDAASRDRPGAANRAFEILRAMMFRAEEWGLRQRDSNPCLGIAMNPRKNLPGSSTRTNWRGSGARSRRTKPAGRRPSPRSACWRSPAAAAAKCSICAGATSVKTRSILRTPRPARGPCRSARPRGMLSTGCPVPVTRTPLCFPASPGSRIRTTSSPVGTLSANTPNLASCACTTFGTRSPARPSCRGKTCPWSVNCSGTGPRRATPILQTSTLSRRRRPSGASLQKQ